MGKQIDYCRLFLQSISINTIILMKFFLAKIFVKVFCQDFLNICWIFFNPSKVSNLFLSNSNFYFWKESQQIWFSEYEDVRNISWYLTPNMIIVCLMQNPSLIQVFSVLLFLEIFVDFLIHCPLGGMNSHYE